MVPLLSLTFITLKLMNRFSLIQLHVKALTVFSSVLASSVGFVETWGAPTLWSWRALSTASTQPAVGWRQL